MKKFLYETKIKVGEYVYVKLINQFKYSFGKKEDKRYNTNKKKIILTLLPNHGNLGDHAIAYASYKFLKDKFKNYEVIQVDMINIYKHGKAIKNSLSEGDFIAIIGGGNMNNLYKHEEWTRRFIIKNFKNVPIVSLPQTIAFTNDKKGNKELYKTKYIYENNKKLILLAREDKSFNIMNTLFKNNKVIKNPDMVFYLENLSIGKRFDREGILICLRRDKEGYISEESRNNIIDNLKEDYEKVMVSDTVIDKRISIDTRDEELDNIWNKFLSSEVVVTDRLHGMIFAVITKTPCIVIRNTDHKITESYNWIRELNYIKLIDDFSYENINDLIKELLDLKELNSIGFKDKYFSKLKEKLVENL